MSERLYYVQDRRTFVGNCILWWAKDHKGYTCHLHKAHVFTEEEVKKLHRETDIPWPYEIVHEAASMQVDCQRLPGREQIGDLLP